MILFLSFTGLWCPFVHAHHVLGRPSYSLNEDSNTPPSMQVETQIGDYFVIYMIFPAFPEPEKPGRIHLYVTRMDDSTPLQGEVTFKVRDKNLLHTEEELLGVQPADGHVFRQGFEFREPGEYTIRAEFESDGEPYQIDFPLQIGDPAPLGPIGVAVSIVFITLLGVNLVQRKRFMNTKIRKAHEAGLRS